MLRKLSLLIRFSAMQGLVQLATVLSGFLLVRVLDKREFAAYTLATSLQIVIGLLTDSGIGTGLNAIGGKVWRNRRALSGLVAGSLQLRFRLAAWVVPFGIVISLILLRQNEIAWGKAACLTLLCTLSLWPLFNNSVYPVPLRLHGKYLAVQRVELLSAVARLVVLGILALGFLEAVQAVFVTLLASTLQAFLLRKRVLEVIEPGIPAGKEGVDELRGLVRKQLFSVFFFAFQGQVTVWLISLFGNVERVAEVGALGRLAVAFGIVASAVSGLAVPAFARSGTLSRLLRLFSLVFSTYLGFALLILLCSLLIPSKVLWILGSDYSNLTHELRWVAANSAFCGLTGVIYGLASARGWIWHAWTIPFATVFLQIAILPAMNLGTVRGVLIFGLVSHLPTFLAATYMAVRGVWTSNRIGSIAPVAT